MLAWVRLAFALDLVYACTFGSAILIPFGPAFTSRSNRFRIADQTANAFSSFVNTMKKTHGVGYKSDPKQYGELWIRSRVDEVQDITYTTPA